MIRIRDVGRSGTPGSVGRVDYDPMAAAYGRRYQLHAYPGVRSTIVGAFERSEGGHVLEVGCGTGRWLAELASAGAEVVAGIDPSAEMLQRAATVVSGDLRLGVAEELPWSEASFDLVLFINALHHFTAPSVAFDEAFRVLRPGGRLVSIGLDPLEGRDRWYVYDFFPQTLVADYARFPCREIRTRWLQAAGFATISFSLAEHLRGSYELSAARAAGVLERSFTSQLAALPEDQYLAGLAKIESAAARDPGLRLQVDLRLNTTEGMKPDA